MKNKIHPKYYPDARIICSCGATFTTGSTKKEITVETCAKCHPFYTGEHRYLDTKGLVETFQRKQQIAQSLQEKRKKYKKKKTAKREQRTKTLKELLSEI